MIISGNIHESVQILDIDPSEIIKKLFEANARQISILINEKFCPLELHTNGLARLILEIADHTEYEDTEKVRVIGEIERIIPMNEVLAFLVPTHGKEVIKILNLLDNQFSSNQFFKNFFSQTINFSSAFYTYLFKAILGTNSEIENKKTWVNIVIETIPIDLYEELFSEMIVQFPISELGKIAGFIKNEDVAFPFVVAVMKHSILEVELTEDRQYNCRILLDQINFILDLNGPKKTAALPILLLELSKEELLNTLVIDQLKDIDESCRLMILWSLPYEDLSTYISVMDIQENPYLPAKILNDLFNIEKDNQKRAVLINIFTEHFNDAELYLFLYALNNTKNSVIPYLLTGLSDEHFEELTRNNSRKLVDELFKKSVPETDIDMKWIVENLKSRHDKNRLIEICENMEFNQPSQDTEMIENIPYPVYLTLESLCNTIKSNEDDPDNFLKFFMDDILATPPFLMALGMHHPEFCGQIALQSKLLTEKQLQAITWSLSENELCGCLDALFEHLHNDQIFYVLETLNRSFVTIYANYKALQYKQLYESIIDVSGLVKLGNQESQLPFLITMLQTKIRTILSPANLQLEKILNSHHSICPKILEMFETCKNILIAIEGPDGILQQINKRTPQTNTESTNINEILDIETLQILELESYEQLNRVGIFTDDDLKIIQNGSPVGTGKKLRKYLDQNQLEPIWKFLNSKQLYSISVLLESFLFEENEEVFEINKLATKLGYTEEQ